MTEHRYPPALPMGHTDEDTRDLHEPRARRYAAALAAAAAADERVQVLTDALADHEWRRTQAEAMVSYFRERMDLPAQVISSTDDEPDEFIGALLDLSDGSAWVRPTYAGGTRDLTAWVRAEATQRGQTRHEWPISDHGPFIPLPDNWALAKVNRDARRRDEQEDAIRTTLREYDGYREEGASGWSVPDLDAAVLRVVHTLYAKMAEARSELNQTQHALRQAEAALAAQQPE